MMDLIDIGKRIKGLRKDAKLTQSKVADFLSFGILYGVLYYQSYRL